MQTTPRVTFVIPSYNHENYVAKAIESVLEQDYPNIELIVIDDGSTDRSFNVISDLRARKDFIFISQSNTGLISVMNRAIELASGEYFCWGGSDDYFDLSRVRLHVESLQSNPESAVSYGRVMYIHNDERPVTLSRQTHNKSGFIFPDLLKRCFIPAPASMIRTEVLREFGGFDPRFFLEDYPLWLKVSKKYPFVYINRGLTFYRIHDRNTSGDLERMVSEVQRILQDWTGEPEYAKAIKYWHFRWFCDLMKQDRVDIAKPFLANATQYGFLYPKLWRSLFRYWQLVKNT